MIDNQAMPDISTQKIPQKINAAVLYQTGEPLQIKSLDVPALKFGQVLVKIFFSGVCRSQLMEVRGGRGDDPWLPHLLGHEGSGIVIGVGEGVTKVEPGDEVILGWIKGDGHNVPGAKYLCDGDVINSGGVTTFSNYSIVSENRVVIKPKKLPLDEAMLFGCALPTGAGMVINEIRPAVDSSVVVLGLGGIGLAALMALRAQGVKTLIAVDVSEEKLAKARELGASQTLNALNEDIVDAIHTITSGGADYCVESAGLVSTIEQGFSLVRTGGGKLLFASHPPEGEKICLAPHELISGKQIAGSWGGAVHPDRDIPHLFDLLRSAKTPFNLLLTKRYSLDQINDALDDLEAGRVFRPLIVMGHADDSQLHRAD